MHNGVEKRLFIAATNQNDGKTTCALGLLKAFDGLAESIGFIKPVGQRCVTVDGQQIDEDTVLVQKACGLTCALKCMSPVAVGRAFTRKFLDDPEGTVQKLKTSIQESYECVARDSDLVIIEGTGHAGVGSVFDLSNARVARLLNAKVVIVTRGGIGRPIDEIALNRALFEKEGVPIVGVIANKTFPWKIEETQDYLTRSLARQGLDLLGVIPYMPRLTWPTVQQIADALDAKVLNGQQCLTNVVVNIIVGAMTANKALSFVRDKTLLIVPGDRDDIVLAAVCSDLLRKDMDVSGIVITGSLQLAQQTMDLVKLTHIPVLEVNKATYDTAFAIHDITVKIQKTDEEKIQLATALVREHVNFKKLWDALS